MKKKLPCDLTIDFLVPATFASRYRARLTDLSRLKGQIRLAFCPRIFRSGISSCPADVTLVFGSVVVRVRGVVEVPVSSNEAVGQVHFDQPLERRDFDAMCEACQIDAVFCEDGDIGPTETLDEPLDAPEVTALVPLH
jgi:hypothetical protein